MKKTISSSVIFFKTTKEIWDILKRAYGNEKNISRIFELYERFFTLKQDKISVSEYYSALQDILDEFEFHQPLVTDLKTLR